MHQYFEKMDSLGKELTKGQLLNSKNNVEQIREEEANIDKKVEEIKESGIPTEKINARGNMTIWQRIEYLVDPGTFFPLHTLYNPEDNDEKTTNVFDGLAKISGKWAVVIYSFGLDRKLLRRKTAGTGKILRKPQGFRGNLFPPCRTFPGRRAHPGRNLRHQPCRRRIPGHQPHGSVCP